MGTFASKKQERETKRTAPNKQRYFIEECEKRLARSTAAPKTDNNSRTALQSFKIFLKEEDILLEKMTKRLICDYERWLLNEKRVNENTAALYMRSLRALYNKVVQERKRKDIFSGVHTTPCKAESIEAATVGEIRKITAFQSDKPNIQLARDIFMFSFYCMGMPFIDVYHLKQNQICGDILTYRRHKTGARVKVGLSKEAMTIMDRYKNKDGTFVFPLNQSEDTDDYERALRGYNSELNKIEKRLRLGIHLSSYVARHTWATLAYSETCDMNIVAGGLGHNSTKVTRTYISSILNGKLQKTNRKILNMLSNRIKPAKTKITI